MDTAWPYNSRCDFPYRRQCSFGSDRLGSESETTWSGSGPASVHLRTRPILCHDRPRSPVGPTCAVGGGPLFRHVNRVSTGRQAETEGSTTTTPVEGVCLPHAGTPAWVLLSDTVRMCGRKTNNREKIPETCFLSTLGFSSRLYQRGAAKVRLVCLVL